MTEIDIIPTGFVPRRLKVVVIGAGFSGIQLAHEILTELPDTELEIYEKNPCLGGTWYENVYPGCTCDVPSHTYQFSWAPNPSWSKLYPPASEIRAYLENVVDNHDLRKYMNFNFRCTSATWSEAESRWTTTLQDTKSTECRVIRSDVFVYAVGRLNNYKVPTIDGADSFRGVTVHTAAWPRDLDTSGKRIVVIGNGASAVQCVAALQPKVSRLVNIFRGPTWILPHVFSEDGSIQSDYTAKEKNDLRNNPQQYYDYRMKLEKKLAAGFPGLWRGTAAKDDFTHKANTFMKSRIKDPSLLSALLPRFEPGCRRFTPGGHYLDALQRPNVEYVRDSVTTLTRDGLITRAGVKIDCDIIVWATGFEPYQPRFPVLGRNGAHLTEKWDRRGPCESYMAAMVADFPNFFVFNPPICPVNGSAIPGIERAANYMVRVLDRLRTDNLRSICVTLQAQQAFNQWVQSRMPHMVWSGPCSSWYKNDDGKVIVPWPGTILHYYAATRIVRWEDFDLRFMNPDQKYDCFGNGVTVEGYTPDSLPWVKLFTPKARDEEERVQGNNTGEDNSSSCIPSLKALLDIEVRI